MFSSSGRKHSQRTPAETGDFTCNFVSRNLVDKMNSRRLPCPTASTNSRSQD